MNNNLEKIKSPEKKEIPKNFDRIYVLASGEPEELDMDSKIRILAAMELAKSNRDAKIYFVGGGVPEEGIPTAKLMSDYFERINHSSKEKISNEIGILDKSNNTVANIEEIIESLGQNPFDSSLAIAILSNDYHGDRIRKILDHFGQKADVIPAENLLAERSSHHEKFVEKYEKSLLHKKKEAIDRIMCIYLNIDPEQSLVKKFRAWRRKK